MIPIKNIYYMLSYAFQTLNEQGYKNLATEDFDNTGDLCAAILIRGISYQLKRGLGREYISETDTRSAIRGKIEITESIKNQSMIRSQMVPEGLRSDCGCVSYSVMSDSLLFCPRNSPGKNTGVGSHSLLLRIFPTQKSNPSLPHCGQILYQLSH